MTGAICRSYLSTSGPYSVSLIHWLHIHLYPSASKQASPRCIMKWPYVMSWQSRSMHCSQWQMKPGRVYRSNCANECMNSVDIDWFKQKFDLINKCSLISACTAMYAYNKAAHLSKWCPLASEREQCTSTILKNRIFSRDQVKCRYKFVDLLLLTYLLSE